MLGPLPAQHGGRAARRARRGGRVQHGRTKLRPKPGITRTARGRPGSQFHHAGVRAHGCAWKRQSTRNGRAQHGPAAGGTEDRIPDSSDEAPLVQRHVERNGGAEDGDKRPPAGGAARQMHSYRVAIHCRTRTCCGSGCSQPSGRREGLGSGFLAIGVNRGVVSRRRAQGASPCHTCRRPAPELESFSSCVTNAFVWCLQVTGP